MMQDRSYLGKCLKLDNRGLINVDWLFRGVRGQVQVLADSDDFQPGMLKITYVDVF